MGLLGFAVLNPTYDSTRCQVSGFGFAPVRLEKIQVSGKKLLPGIIFDFERDNDSDSDPDPDPDSDSDRAARPQAPSPFLIPDTFSDPDPERDTERYRAPSLQKALYPSRHLKPDTSYTSLHDKSFFLD